MAGVKISELIARTTLTGEEVVPVAVNGSNAKVAINTIGSQFAPVLIGEVDYEGLPSSKNTDGKVYLVHNGTALVSIYQNGARLDATDLTIDDLVNYYTKSEIDSMDLTPSPAVIFNNSYNKKNSNHRLRILTFGSSLFCCSWLYLNKILSNLGIKNEIHGYYMGHSQFNEWLKFFNGDMSPVQGSESSRGCGQYISVDGSDWTVRGAGLTASSTYTYEQIARTTFAQDWVKDLTEQKRDIIILQQGAHQACNPTYWTNQEAYIEMVKQFATTDTVIGFNETRAPGTNGTWNATDTDYLPVPATNDVAGQHVFLSEHFSRVKDFMVKTGIYNISPSGVVLQMLREYNTARAGSDYTRDTLHPTNGLPMFAIASTLYQSIIAPMTGIHIKNCTWRPDAETIRTPFSSSYFVAMTAAQAYTIYNYVDVAIANRFTIIPSAYTKNTRTASVDVGEGGVAALANTSGSFVDTPVSNTLTINANSKYKPSKILHNGKKIPLVDGNTNYTLGMTYGYNLVEVDFEKAYQEELIITYNITTNISNGTITLPATTIDEGGSATIVFGSSSGYSNPSTISVTNAQYTYNSETGTIVLSYPTGDVTVDIVCASSRTITTSITNGFLLNNPSSIVDTATIVFEPGLTAYTYPQNVTVTGASYTYDDTTGTINLSNPTDNVTVDVSCPMVTVVEDTPITISTDSSLYTTPLGTRNSGTITTNRYFLPGKDGAGARAWTGTWITSWKGQTGDWMQAPYFLPAGKKLTVHVSSAHDYTVVLAKYPAGRLRMASVPTYEYRAGTYHVGNYDVHGAFDGSDTIITTQIQNNPYLADSYATYFPFNSSNDFEYVNESGDVLYFWIGFARAYSFDFSSIQGTYTISDPITPTQYSITSNISHGTLTTNPTTITDTATIQFEPEYLAWTYPQNVTVTGASYTYDDTTGTINLSNPTDNVTVDVSCPVKPVQTNTPISVATSNYRQDSTTTITYLRFAFINPSLSGGNIRATLEAPQATDVAQESGPARVRAAIYVPAGHKITFHMNSTTHKYTGFASYYWLAGHKPNTGGTRDATYYYWKGVYQIGDNLTSINSAVFDGTDTYIDTSINPNPQTATTFDEYFNHNSTSDYEISNPGTEPLFVWLVVAGQTTNSQVSIADIGLEYTYSLIS